jgi:hypothetical protein
MSDLIRPLATRVDEARLSLAGSPVEPEPLVFDLSDSAQLLDSRAPGVGVNVREQVIREALDDALAYHCDDPCPHVTDPGGWVCAVLLSGRIMCPRCIYVAEYDEDGQPVMTEPWQGTGEAPCTLCASELPLVSILTRLTPTGIVYASHVCAICAAWWPPRRDFPEPEPPPANAGVTVRIRQGSR